MMLNFRYGKNKLIKEKKQQVFLTLKSYSLIGQIMSIEKYFKKCLDMFCGTKQRYPDAQSIWKFDWHWKLGS